jgi:molybdate transport system substrate-binding protein
MKKGYFLKSIMLLTAVASIALAGCQGTEKSEETKAIASESESKSEKEVSKLTVYAGAGLKNAMEDIKTSFEAENDNVQLEYIYAGSAQLLSQIETSGKGDVFIVGSEVAYNAAKEKGLAGERKLVAHHTPAIAVQKGNPKGISSLEDLGKDGIKVALGDSESNAIGKTADKIIEKNGLQTILNNVVTRTATVNEIATAIVSGNADAGIVTEDAVYANEKIEIVKIAESQNIDQIIPVCALQSSEQSDLAQRLVDFIASEKGKAIFEQNGFKPVSE